MPFIIEVGKGEYLKFTVSKMSLYYGSVTTTDQTKEAKRFTRKDIAENWAANLRYRLKERGSYGIPNGRKKVLPKNIEITVLED